MKKFKYLIMSQSYDENVGGYVVLHKLCDELNRQGFTAKLVPAFNCFTFSKKNFVRPFLRFAKERLRRLRSFKTNPAFLTPIATDSELYADLDEWIVVYPETVSGNPLGAKNVVRWFLHHPGFHVPDCYFGLNELYFKYHSGIKVPDSLLANTAVNELRVVHYPLNLYNLEGVSNSRIGSAYAIRKGVGKKIVHDLNGSVLIDGKSHEEIAKIFKSVKVFYSYDPYTAYSTFAALCGCDSVVVPDDGISRDDWIPEVSHRAGISYGSGFIEEARRDRAVLVERVNSELSGNVENVLSFTRSVDVFFGVGN